MVAKIDKDWPRLCRGISHVRPHLRAPFRTADTQYHFLGNSRPSDSLGPGLADTGTELHPDGRLLAVVPSNLSLLCGPARLASGGCQAVCALDCSSQVPPCSGADPILAQTPFRSAQPGHRISRFCAERGPGGGLNYTVRIHRLGEVENIGNKESRPTASRRVLGNGLYCRLARSGTKHYPRRLTRRGL